MPINIERCYRPVDQNPTRETPNLHQQILEKTHKQNVSNSMTETATDSLPLQDSNISFESTVFHFDVEM